MIDILSELEMLRRRLERVERQEQILPMKARVYNDANISIPNNTLTALTFNSERFDTGGFHNTSVNTARLTIPITGTYLVGGAARFASNTTGSRQVNLRVDAVTYIARHNAPATAGLVFLSISTLTSLNSGSYVEFVVNQDSGGALNVEVDGSWSPWFWIIGPF